MATELEKQAAAGRSIEFVHEGSCVGLGSGTTASYAIRMLGEKVRQGLDIRGVPTSIETMDLAKGLGIPLVLFEKCPVIDVTIDGADEISPSLDLVKGGGGALLREKLVASVSKVVVIIADSSKRVEMLGKTPLPVEVIPCAHTLLTERIKGLGAEVSLRKDNAGLPFVTDEGHYILDCAFGRITNPAWLAEELKLMPGVVDHGLFLNMADIALVGTGNEVIELQNPRKSDSP
jgi:ribose 5-phosphate isomerase A